jgi:hypothetical protein
MGARRVRHEQAAAVGVEALELANNGRWGELLAMQLPDQVIEMVRQKASINTQVEILEEQERVLWELIVALLQKEC